MNENGDPVDELRELAKARLRKLHHRPTIHWEWHQILRLMDANPVDEAILQRSLYAINKKLQLLAAEHVNILEQVTLDDELRIVSRLHTILYEHPWNARIQILGHQVLDKLLPSAYAKALYKAQIDPYFNL